MSSTSPTPASWIDNFNSKLKKEWNTTYDPEIMRILQRREEAKLNWEVDWPRIDRDDAKRELDAAWDECRLLEERLINHYPYYSQEEAYRILAAYNNHLPDYRSRVGNPVITDKFILVQLAYLLMQTDGALPTYTRLADLVDATKAFGDPEKRQMTLAYPVHNVINWLVECSWEKAEPGLETKVPGYTFKVAHGWDEAQLKREFREALKREFEVWGKLISDCKRFNCNTTKIAEKIRKLLPELKGGADKSISLYTQPKFS